MPLDFGYEIHFYLLVVHLMACLSFCSVCEGVLVTEARPNRCGPRYPVATRVALSGTLLVARDIAHAKLKAVLDAGEPLPEYMLQYPVYYAGPAKTPVGMPSGSAWLVMNIMIIAYLVPSRMLYIALARPSVLSI